MQRRPTSNTRGPNADERRYQAWLKLQPCIYCGQRAPSICDHARGATFKNDKVLIGHWYCTSKCQRCDDFKTHGNHRTHYRETNTLESSAWLVQSVRFTLSSSIKAPLDVIDSIHSFAGYEKRMYT